MAKLQHNLNLNWLRSFEATARLLSFTAASVEIGLTQTAVSQHIKALENKLGEKLFIRRPKSLRLTDAGTAYLPKIQEALDTIEMSTTGLFGPRQDSIITVRASMAIILWLTPKIEEFQSTHSDIGIKFITSLWKNSTDQQPVDIDIVLASNENTKPNLKKLSNEFIVPIISANTQKQILKPSDLLKQKPVHIMGFDDHWARYLSAFSLKPERTTGSLLTDTSVVATEMVSTGQGCAVVIERFAKQAIASGRPICIVGSPIPLGQSFYLAQTDAPSNKQPNVIAFEKWLKTLF